MSWINAKEFNEREETNRKPIDAYAEEWQRKNSGKRKKQNKTKQENAKNFIRK